MVDEAARELEDDLRRLEDENARLLLQLSSTGAEVNRVHEEVMFLREELAHCQGETE